MLHRKFTATATMFLMLAMLLASAQALTPQELATFMQLANSGVAGNYTPLATLSAQFKAEAVALKSWADELHSNGGDQNIQAFINNHKTQFLAPISLPVLEQHYKAAVAAGYKGDINDYSKALKGVTLAQRQAALNQMNRIGLYKVMVQISQNFAQASAEASRLSRERPSTSHLLTVAYQPVLYFNLPTDSCNELSVGMALFAYSGLMLDGVGIGLAFGVIAIGIGVVKDIYC